MTTTGDLLNDMSMCSQPTHEQIATLAFHIFLKEGCPEGLESDIWRRAEQMLREKGQPPRAARPIASPGTRATRSFHL